MTRNFPQLGHAMEKEDRERCHPLCRILLKGEKNGIFAERNDDTEIEVE